MRCGAGRWSRKAHGFAGCGDTPLYALAFQEYHPDTVSILPLQILFFAHTVVLYHGPRRSTGVAGRESRLSRPPRMMEGTVVGIYSYVYRL